MRILIIGCGYVGLAAGAKLARLGHEVSGLRRSTAGHAELAAAGMTPLTADITRPETLAGLPGNWDSVVNTAAASGGSAEDYRRLYLEGARNLAAWLTNARLGKYIYTSSTGVYGQNDGSWVDETGATEPTSPTARILVETEQTLLDVARHKDFPAVILRIAGIYGPGRGYYLRQMLNEEARIEGTGERFINMVHRDDVAGAIVAALERATPGTICNVCDDEPVTQLELYTWLARYLGRDLPPHVAETPEILRRRAVTNKRISNRKLRTELACALEYPTFREGYAAELARLGYRGR